EKLAVGYSFDRVNYLKAHIKRYTYSSSFNQNTNLSSLHSHFIQDGTRFGFRNTNQIAIRDNWEVFYNVTQSFPSSPASSTIRFLNQNGSNGGEHFKQSKDGFVAVDKNNRLIMSQYSGSVVDANDKVKLYDSGNALIRTCSFDTGIENGFSSLIMYA